MNLCQALPVQCTLNPRRADDAARRQAEALQAEPQVLTLDDEDDQDAPLTVT
jgi:hypothetical protein